MQIHELNSFVGTPSATDYLAIDDGTETNKVPATALGVSTQMTQAEAEAGTVTDPRVVTPAVFKSSVDALAENVAESTIRQITGFETGNANKAVASSTITTVTTVQIPDGEWLLISYMDLGDSGNGVYNHVLGLQTVRSTAANGGGSINAMLLSSAQNVNISTYVPFATTARVSWMLIKVA